MKEYIQNVVTHRKNYITIHLNRNVVSHSYDIVLKSLSLKNLNDLRDRDGGVAFHNRFSTQFLGDLALENFLKVKFVDWASIQKEIKYTSQIKISSQEISINSSNYGEFPLIDNKVDKPIIFIVRKDEQNFWICGYASLILLKKYKKEYINNFPEEKKKEQIKFTGFSDLIYFKELAELENILLLPKSSYPSLL